MGFVVLLSWAQSRAETDVNPIFGLTANTSLEKLGILGVHAVCVAGGLWTGCGLGARDDHTTP